MSAPKADMAAQPTPPPPFDLKRVRWEGVQYDTYGFWRSERQIAHKVARFRQINQNRRDVHHDALEFPDGRIVLLTKLCEGQRATVLQLPAVATADEAERRHPSRHRDLRTVA